MPSPNVVVENVSGCSLTTVPSIEEYFNTSFYAILATTLGGVVLVLVILLFVNTLRHILHNAPSRVKTHTAYLLTIYPVTCFLYYLPLVVPAAYLLSEALVQVLLMAAMYQLFCLFTVYCDGEAQLVKQVKEVNLKVNTLPICCCFVCLPSYTVSKRVVKVLKWQVLQLPIVQGLLYFIALVVWMENEQLYENLYWYIQPLVIVSLLVGLWGMNMLAKLLTDSLDPDYGIRPKMAVLQLLVPITKLQGFITKSLIKYDQFPCNPPLTPQLYGILIQNSVTVVEVAVLAFCARRVYRKMIPCLDNRSLNAGGIVSTVYGSTLSCGVNVLTKVEQLLATTPPRKPSITYRSLPPLVSTLSCKVLYPLEWRRILAFARETGRLGG